MEVEMTFRIEEDLLKRVQDEAAKRQVTAELFIIKAIKAELDGRKRFWSRKLGGTY